MVVRVGMRLRCESCGSEAIVTAAGGAELVCCGAPLTVTFEPVTPEAAGSSGASQA